MKIGYAKTLTGKLDSVTQETFIDQYAVEKFYVDKISSTSLDAPRLTDTQSTFSCALPYPPHRAERQMGAKATPGV